MQPTKRNLLTNVRIDELWVVRPLPCAFWQPALRTKDFVEMEQQNFSMYIPCSGKLKGEIIYHLTRISEKVHFNMSNSQIAKMQ